MNSRKIEYNPLFESVSDVAKRYRIINEEVSPEYKLKVAKEYAVMILQVMYDNYLYFVGSIPNETLKKSLKAELFNFVKSEYDKQGTVTFSGFMDSLKTKWTQSLSAITSNSDLIKLSAMIKEIYNDVDKGMKELENAAKLYNEKYPTESNSPEVSAAVQGLVQSCYTSLSASATTTA